MNDAGHSTDVVQRLRRTLDDYRPGARVAELGRLESVGDGIAWVSGLPSAAMEEILEFDDGSEGLVFQLNESRVGAILLSEGPELTAGTAVQLTGRQLSLPVGEELLGRVIDPLGHALDGGDAPACHSRRRLEHKSPPVANRDFVRSPLYTGCKIVDTMIPIGRGQRQLLIGDEGLGRTSLALDAVISQRGDDVLCVYVLVGQKRSAILNTVETLRDHGAMDYTCVVVAEASALPGMKYLAPFAGCAVAEAFMYRGRHTLVVYDDLSTHAAAYRELSLLLRRPPGREAYPGDIFYLHARLLERATHLDAAHGGGSMTALPIVATQQGEIAAYIPTNLISITDGQIYLDAELFASGFRPAIDVPRSVSRIGGKAQHEAMKKAAGRLKLDYLQFLEMEMFTRFGARLESTMAKRMQRGRILREVLKQDRLSPLPPAFQLAWMTAFNEGLLDDRDPEDVPALLEQLQGQWQGSGLNLDSDPEQWRGKVRDWLAMKGEASE
jgi:F-type H+-transporting ATPase subunit alpha